MFQSRDKIPNSESTACRSLDSSRNKSPRCKAGSARDVQDPDSGLESGKSRHILHKPDRIRCQAKYQTCAKFLTCCCFSVILLLKS